MPDDAGCQNVEVGLYPSWPTVSHEPGLLIIWSFCLHRVIIGNGGWSKRTTCHRSFLARAGR
jgi:hypothetical protein